MLRRIFTFCVIFVVLFAGCLAAVAQASGTKWAVVIGISDYQEDSYKLKYAHLDAQKIQERLLDSGMDKDHLTLLVNQEATRANIAGVFEDTMARNVGPDDAVFIYFSGHGYQGDDLGKKDEKDGMDEYILPVDSVEGQVASWIRDDDFNGWITGIKARLIVIVFDSCHAGGATRNAKTVGQRSRAPLEDSFFRDIGKEGTVVMAACKDSERAIEDDDLKLGLFTYHLLNTFKGSRDLRANDDETLFQEVQKKVHQDNPSQTPVFINNATGISNPISEFFPPPGIEITLVPRYDRVGGPDSYEDIAGTVVGVDPEMASKNYAIVLYVRTERWYVQPTLAEPLTPIDVDGSWSNWTHGGKKYAVLLVKSTYEPPGVVGQLPRVGKEVIASIIVDGKR